MATTDIGNWWSGTLPKGTQGIIVDEGGWGAPLRVAFTLPGGFFSSDEVVTLDVDHDDVALI
ncbi:hypothetical protein ACFU8R_04360 [Pseudonocardia alni]|uniref:hypothetical protein n=1 Tax=Pseudonocardia alni TaxID=33907 RepID=UPI0036A442F3